MFFRGLLEFLRGKAKGQYEAKIRNKILLGTFHGEIRFYAKTFKKISCELS